MPGRFRDEGRGNGTRQIYHLNAEKTGFDSMAKDYVTDYMMNGKKSHGTCLDCRSKALPWGHNSLFLVRPYFFSSVRPHNASTIQARFA
jgi:hypothetical protein